MAADIKVGQISRETFEHFHPGLSLIEPLKIPGIQTILDNFFGINKHWLSPITFYRRVSPKQADFMKTFQEPLKFHIDAQYFYTACFGLNFWTPLTNCGVNAPSLCVVLKSIDSVKKFVKFDPETLQFSQEALASLNDLKSEAVPVKMEPGEILVFTNWCIHATYSEDHMKEARSSLEVRFCHSEMEFPYHRS